LFLCAPICASFFRAGVFFGAFSGGLSVVWGFVGRVSPRRATFFFASPKKKARKATRLPRSSALRPTALRCSQRAAGAELVGCASSDSRAGLPRPLLRCSAGQDGLFCKHRAFAEAGGDDRQEKQFPNVS